VSSLSEGEGRSLDRGGFETTKWTLVEAAGRATDKRARMAVEELCKTYWYPLYAHVRRRGHSKEDAEDLTQAFFARFLEKNYLEGLSPEKGRFRAFLLASLKNFLANEWDKSQRKKRGGGLEILSLEWQDADKRYRIDPVDELSPEKLFDRAWAMTLLARVVEKLAGVYVGNESFEKLKPCLTAERGTINYAEVAGELGMSEGAVRVAAHRLRRQYREFLRAEIAETLVDPGLVEDEMSALFRAFSE
jgi:RNA polymerase sigma factor (sigma-70 family)